MIFNDDGVLINSVLVNICVFVLIATHSNVSHFRHHFKLSLAYIFQEWEMAFCRPGSGVSFVCFTL